MDEPTAVLTPQEAEALFETLRAMADEGKTVIFISHKLHEVKAVADRVTVLRGGRTVATVDAAPATLSSLAALMVGREIDVVRPLEQAEAAVRRPDPRSGGLDRRRRSGRSRRERRFVRDPRGRDRRRRGRRGQRPARAGRGALGDARPPGGERPCRRQAAARRRSARGDPGRRRPRARGSARNGPRSEPERHEQRRHQDVPKPLAFARSAPPASTHARGCRRDHPPLRREDPRAGNARTRPLRRQPPEARPGARVRGRPARPRRRSADARSRRRRDRDGALVPPRRGCEGRRDPAHERGPRRDPRARRPDPRRLRGRDRRRASCGFSVDRGDRPAHGRRDARDEARASARPSRGGCPSPFRSARSSSPSR